MDRTVRVRADPARLARGAQVLAAPAPRGPYFPDFVTPPDGIDGLDAGMAAVLGTPGAGCTTSPAASRATAVPAWARDLADGDVAALTTLTTVLRSYHAVAIEPYATTIQAVVDAGHGLRHGAGETLLRAMAPLMRRRPPVLEVRYRVDRDLRLAGRGLLLVSSYFCLHTPVALAAVDDGATTTESAGRAGTSLGSAGRHTRVLREAGLIDTTRHGGAVRHTLTPLGTVLLSTNGTGGRQ